MKLLKITWKDARTIHDISHPLEEVKTFDLLKVESIGYLVHEDKQKIILCSMVFYEYNNEKYYKTLHIIPKNVVIKREVLI